MENRTVQAATHRTTASAELPLTAPLPAAALAALARLERAFATTAAKAVA